MTLGKNVESYSPDLVELLKAMDLDWVLLDYGHWPMNEVASTNMVRPADLTTVGVRTTTMAWV